MHITELDAWERNSKLSRITACMKDFHKGAGLRPGPPSSGGQKADSFMVAGARPEFAISSREHLALHASNWRAPALVARSCHDVAVTVTVCLFRCDGVPDITLRT